MEYINKIYNMDYEEYFKKIPDNSIDLIITDPPYGINYQNQYTHILHEKIVNDNEFFSYIKLAKEAYRILKNNTAFFIFTGWSTYPKHFIELKEAGFIMKEPIICHKRGSGTHDLQGSFQSNCDWIMFGHKGRFKFKKTKLIKNKKSGIIPNKGRKPILEYKTRFPSNWFGDDFPKSTENSSFQKYNNIYHPTIKNSKFIEYLIQLSTNSNDIICDPFIGTGTSAIAAIKTNRKYTGCEIVDKYYTMCQNRINNVLYV